MSDQTEPARVSVIIPAYNASATLGAQLEALASQVAAPAFEVLVCDNGSTDATADVAHAHAAAFTHLRVIDASARRGPAAARNIGVANAQAPIVAFCDADDVVASNWLVTLVGALKTADAAAGGFEHDHLTARHAITVSWGTDVPIRLASWPQLPAGASSNLAVTRAAFEAVQGFDASLHTGEDVDLCWRLQLAGFSLAFVPHAVVHARKRSGTRAIYRQSVAYARGTVILEDKHRERLGYDVALGDDTHQTAGEPFATTQLPTGPTEAPTSRVRALAARLRRPDRLTLIGDAAWRLGQRRVAGERGRTALSEAS